MIQAGSPGSLHYQHKSNEQFTGAGLHTQSQQTEDFLLTSQELRNLQIILFT